MSLLKDAFLLIHLRHTHIAHNLMTNGVSSAYVLADTGDGLRRYRGTHLRSFDEAFGIHWSM